MTKQYRNHNIRFSMTDEGGVQAWERLHSEEVEQKLLSNLPALAAMYQMQQQAFFQAGLQAGGIMPYPYQHRNPGAVTQVGVKPVTEPTQSNEQSIEAGKQEQMEPEENEFMDYSFGV